MRAASQGSLGAEIEGSLRDLNWFLQEAGIYLLVVIFASGGSFIFQNLMAADEWWGYADRAEWRAGDFPSYARPVFEIVSGVTRASVPLHPFGTVLFYAALTLFAFAVFRRWSVSPWVRLAVVSLFVSSPFLVENLLFTWNQIPMSVALLLLCLWFSAVSCTNAPAKREMSWAAVTAGGLAAALAITIRSEIAVLMLGAAIIEVARALLQDEDGVANRLLPVVASLIITMLAVIALVAIALLLGRKGLYAAAGPATSDLVGSGADVRDSFLRFLTYWKMFLFKPHYLLPAAAKVLVWVIAAAAILQSLLARDLARLLVIILVAMLLSALPLAPGLASVPFPYVYAAVFPLALFPCFLTAVAMTVPQGFRAARGVAFVSAALIVVMGATSLSSAQVRLANLNRRDVSTITQFLGVIRSSGEANWKLAALGNYSSGQIYSWSRNRDQCSVFDCGTALKPLLRLTLLERNPEARVFTLGDAERARLQPDLDALPEGSAKLVRLDQQRFVILLK